MKTNQERIFTALLLLIITTLTSIDIIEDFTDGTSFRHLGLDLAVALFSAIAVVFLLIRFAREQAKVQALQSEKRILQDIASQNKKRSKILIDGLGVQIDQEFTDWKLSNSEREIAMLLLKGLSAHEVADIRKSSEKTVRNQIAAIYRKAGLKNRQELQAYFLEDLLGPSPVGQHG